MWPTGPNSLTASASSVDGEPQTGEFAHEFTLAEIRTLGATVTESERSQQNNGNIRIAVKEVRFFTQLPFELEA